MASLDILVLFICKIIVGCSCFHLLRLNLGQLYFIIRIQDEIKQEYIPQSVNPKTSALSKKASLVHLLVCYIIQARSNIIAYFNKYE